MLIGGVRIPVWLVIGWLLSLLTILAWPLVAISPLFAFDDPAATVTPGLVIYAVFAICYPVLPLAGVAGSLIAFRKGRKKLTYLLTAVAVIPLIAFALDLTWISIGMVTSLFGGLR